MSSDGCDDSAGVVGCSVAEAELAREIRRRRRAAKLSQNQLANLVGYTREYVSRAERPGRGLASRELVAAIDAALGANGALVALHTRARQERCARRAKGAVVVATARGRPPSAVADHSPSADDEDMKRRRFLAHAAAVVVGAVSFDVDRWEAVAAQTDPLPGRLGVADVEQVEQLTSVLRAMDYQHGGGVCRGLALAQLDRARRLLSVPCPESLQRRLWVAIADVHNLVRWASFDVGLNDSARVHFAQALELARGAQEPSLVAHVLYHAGRVYLHHGWAQDALRLFQLGQIAAKDSGSQLSLAVLSANEAWAYAHLGDSRLAEESLQRAREEFARADRSSEPAWISNVTHAEIDGLDGAVQLALARTNPAHASTALERTANSLAVRGPDMARSRAFDTVGLATGYLLAGEGSEGVSAGHRALEMVTGLRSRRALDRLTPLAEAAAQYRSDGARDLIRRIRRLQNDARVL